MEEGWQNLPAPARLITVLHLHSRKLNHHPFLVANHLLPASYVSLQSVLAYFGMIPGHMPVMPSVPTSRTAVEPTPALIKPSACQAFLLTKLLSNTIGTLVFIVGLPGQIVLGAVFLATRQLVLLVPFLVGAGV